YDQGDAVPEIMRHHGFSEVRVTKDLAGLDRVVSGQWRAQENAANAYTMKASISGLTGSDGTSAQENTADGYTMEGV
ncbi:MAG: hypothetical protein LUF30_13235, partial [Lachnospiraceae bacterium]|nr:hypothetical protein [Lachnospiraceae bacterium]